MVVSLRNEDMHPVMRTIIDEKSSLTNYYDYLIRQMRVSSTHTGDDVFNYAFLAIKVHIGSPDYEQNPIQSPKSYAKTVGFNYLTVVKKNESKCVNLDCMAEIVSDHSQDECEEYFPLQKKALEKIKKSHPRSYELINLFYFQKKSWLEIALMKEPKLMNRPEELKRAIAKYKTRGHRAMTKLRLIFFEILDD